MIPEPEYELPSSTTVGRETENIPGLNKLPDLTATTDTSSNIYVGKNVPTISVAEPYSGSTPITMFHNLEDNSVPIHDRPFAPGKDYFGSSALIDRYNLTFSELVKYSDVIAIGVIGPVIDRDHSDPPLIRRGSRKYDTIDYLRWADQIPKLGPWRRMHSFNEIYIVDIWKGKPHTPFIIGRLDKDYYGQHVIIGPVEEGSHVLIFASYIGQPYYETDVFDHFYSVGGDNGVFDLDEQNRAFPRMPNFFTELHASPIDPESFAAPYTSIPIDNPDQLGLTFGDGALDPYISLDDIHTLVSILLNSK